MKFARYTQDNPVTAAMHTPSRVARVPSQIYLLAPGDHVIRYVNGEPFLCTVISVEPDQKIRVSREQWPSGYTAIVDQSDLAIVNYATP